MGLDISHHAEAILADLQPEAVEQMKRFVDFNARDMAELKALAPLVAQHADEIVDALYDRIQNFTALNRLIERAGSSVERLKKTQRNYLLELFSGDYGMDYFRRRLRIGLIHNQIGLGPEWYIGAYSIYRQQIMRLLTCRYWFRPRRLEAAVNALDKLLALDAEQAIGSCIQSVLVDLKRVNVSKSEIEQRVNAYSRAIDAVAAGELSQRIEVDGEDDLAQLGHSLNAMTEQLSTMTKEIVAANGALLQSLGPMQKVVADLSSGASEQAAAVNETTSTLAEIRSTSQQTLEKAGSLGQAAERTREAGDRGLEIVEQNINVMQSIRTKVEAIAQTIMALSKQSQQIGEITNVVAGLAQHSKMLALNASIEAAKAGESGKGFAVVAAEVKDLAEQSSESTSQVQKILTEIRHATDRAVMATEEGTKGVDQGVALMERAREVVSNLRDVIHHSVIASQQIVAAVRQEAVGIDQVATAMGEINQVTEQFVSATKRTAEMNGELARLADRLQSMIKRLRT